MKRFCVIAMVSLFFLSCTDIYQPKVEMKLSSVKDTGEQVGIGDMIYARDAEPTYDLDAPTQLLVSQGIYNNKVELSWTPVKNANCYKVEWVRIKRDEYDSRTPAAKKEIEYKEGSDIDGVNAGIKDNLFTNTWTHIILQNPLPDSDAYDYYYFYKVTAQNTMNDLYKSDRATTPKLLPELDADGNEYPLFNKRNPDGSPVTEGIVKNNKDVTEKAARYVASFYERLVSHFVRTDAEDTSATPESPNEENKDSDTQSSDSENESAGSTGSPTPGDGSTSDDGVVDNPAADGHRETVATITQGNNMGYLFGTPQNVQATRGESTLITGTASSAYNDVVVSWNPVPGADYYHVYKSTNQAGNNASLQKDADTKSDACRQTHFRDDVSGYAGISYYYMVAAVKKGNESCLTSPCEGYAKQEGAPEPPAFVEVVDGLGKDGDGGSLKIRWTLQEASPLGTLSYAIYRSKSSDGFSSTEKLKEGLAGTRQKAAPRALGNSRADSTDSTQKTEVWCDEPFSDSNVVPGVVYCYYVQTVLTKTNGDAVISSFSNTGMKTEDKNGNKIDNENRAIGFLLAPPQNEVEVSNVEGQDGKVDLAWSLPPPLNKNGKFNDATKEFEDDDGYHIKDLSFKYVIYKGDSKDNVNTPVDTVTGNVISGRNGYLTSQCDSAKYFAIATENGGKTSGKTPSVAPAPNAPIEVYASKTEKIDGFMSERKNANANGVYPVKVTWKKPNTGLEPTYYAVQRSDKKTGSFKTITSVLIKKDGAFEDMSKVTSGASGLNGDTYYYIDESTVAKPQVYYYYKVVSKNDLKQGAKSNTFTDSVTDSAEDRKARGYGALTHDQWFREFNKQTISSHKKMEHLNKKSSLDKLGHDVTNGEITGDVDYNAKMDGLGARITIYFDNYCDTLIKSMADSVSAKGSSKKPSANYLDSTGFDYRYFTWFGNTNTSASMDESGTMDGTVYVTKNGEGSGTNPCGNNEMGGAMYPGTCVFDKLKVKGGDAGGGVYPVTLYDLKGEKILDTQDVKWNAAM